METEGVIKYQLDYLHQHIHLPESIPNAESWRTLLWQLGLIGQNKSLYGGLGYGNISVRGLQDQFYITGTQTGHLQRLTHAHWSLILDADPYQNALSAIGSCRPSSEALTHASVYMASPSVNCVVHVHSPIIWSLAENLVLDCIPSTMVYGTSEMALAVSCGVESKPEEGVIAMLGHTDGIISYARDTERAVMLVLKALAHAYQFKALFDDTQRDFR